MRHRWLGVMAAIVAWAGASPAQAVVTPQQFGAVADGRTDDSEAMREAMFAAVRQDEALHLPGGVYLLSKWKQVIVPGNLRMVGDPRAELVGPGRDVVFVYFRGPEAEFENIIFRNWKAPIWLASATVFERLRIELCLVLDCQQMVGDNSGDSGSRLRWVEFRRNWVERCDRGIQLRLSQIDHCVVAGNVFLDLGGEQVEYVSGVMIGGNETRGGGPRLVENNYISRVWSMRETEVHGILCYGPDTVIRRNVVMHVANGHWAWQNAAEAIYAKGPQAQILDNRVVSGGGEAAVIIKGARPGEPGIQSFGGVIGNNRISFDLEQFYEAVPRFRGKLDQTRWRGAILLPRGGWIVDNGIRGPWGRGIGVTWPDTVVSGNRVACPAGAGIKLVNNPPGVQLTDNEVEGSKYPIFHEESAPVP